MAKTKGKKRGPRKGVPKPFKRPLDDYFPVRLRKAMERAGYVYADNSGRTMNAALGRSLAVTCRGATIGQYLSTEKRKPSIDALLLLDLCDALWVTPYWLAKNEGTIDDVGKHKIPMEDLRKKTS